MKLKIKKWGINGEGIGYKDGKPVFVKGALPGEVADVKIEKRGDHYSIAHLINVIEPNCHRRFPPCSQTECDGCALMHVNYKGQCQMKTAILKQALAKYADYHGKIEPLVKNDSVFAYRNSCKLPVKKIQGQLQTGMFKTGSQQFYPIERCLVHEKELERVRTELLFCLRKHNIPCLEGDGYGLRHIVIKEFEKQIQIILVTTSMTIEDSAVRDILNLENVCSLWQSIKDHDTVDIFGPDMHFLGGQRNMILHIENLQLELLPRSFFQLNTLQAKKLYLTIKDWLEPCDSLVEAYSGIGAMSLLCASKAKQVYGIEWIDDAVSNANANAKANGLDHVHFKQGDAAKLFSKIKKVDALIVDPPRSGLDRPMKQAILEKKPHQILYVSCNPSTLAKDLADLRTDYKVDKIQPFDMFSQTQHVETVVSLRKIASKK